MNKETREMLDALSESINRSRELLDDLLRETSGDSEPHPTTTTPKTAQTGGHGSRREHLFGAQPEQPPEEPARAFKGFRIIECPGCGDRYFYYQKEPAERCTVACRKCGVIASLRYGDTLPVFLHCPACGKTVAYQTNIADEEFSWRCMNCKTPTRLMRNYLGNAFVTDGRGNGGGER